MLTGGLAALGSALLFGIAALWQAQAARDLPDFGSGDLGSFLRSGLRSRLLLLVAVAYLFGFALHAVAIWFLPLYLAQAAIAAALPITAMLSAYRLHEPLGTSGILGVIGVTGGLGLLGLGAAGAGSPVTTTAYALWLWAGLGAVLVLGVLVSRGRGAALIGVLAGCGYTGTALGVRGVDYELSWPVLAATLVVPAYGLLAFWLYSSALTRTSLTTAAAGVLGVQTFVPALIGIAFLGDGIREGFSWAVLTGLMVTLLGAVTLAGRTGQAPVPPAPIPQAS